MKITISIGLAVGAILMTAFLAVIGYQEFVRLGSGKQLGLLQLSLEARVESTDTYTHGSGPPLSIYTNGRLDDLKYRYDTASAHGTIQFADGGSSQIDLEATEIIFESELRAKFPVPTIDVRHSITIDADFLKKSNSNWKDLTIRVSGSFFVTYLMIHDWKKFPKSGVISLIAI